MIEFDGLSFGYGARSGRPPERPVLREVDLTLEAGSLHFLTGRSGAGKSTLLKLVYLALTPSAGALRLFGADSAEISRSERARLRRRLGLVLQERDLLDHLTVTQNVALPLVVAGEDAAARAEDVAELVEWVGLTQRAKARPAELSSGERRRATIARALIGSPELIVADEPTGDLDPETADRVMKLFIELNRIGKTVLIATHDLSLVRKAQGTGTARTLRIVEGRVMRAGADL